MIKLILTGVLSIAGYVLLLIFDTGQTGKADKIITTIESICFVFTFLIYAYGLINIIAAERDKRTNIRFISDAKKFIIMGIFLHVCYVVLSFLWLDSMRKSPLLDIHLDILYGLVDMFLCCFSWIGLQYVMNTTIRKSIIPGVRDPEDILIGECLLVLGVSEETLKKALEMQKKGTKSLSSLDKERIINI